MTQKKGFEHLRRTILASNGTNCFLSSSQKTQKINDYYIFKQKPFNMKDLHSITPSLHIIFFLDMIATLPPLDSLFLHLLQSLFSSLEEAVQLWVISLSTDTELLLHTPNSGLHFLLHAHSGTFSIFIILRTPWSAKHPFKNIVDFRSLYTLSPW